MAEWLKIEVALAHGICAAARVELPARFLWRTYRAVLGRDAVAPKPPLDKHPLTWRLMACCLSCKSTQRLPPSPDF